MSRRRPKPQKPSKGKRIAAPRVDAEKPPQQQTPIFCLHYLCGQYCLTKCDKDHQSAFARWQHTLSQLTWQQIEIQRRHGQGYERLPREILKASIPSHVTEDVNLIAFRYLGKNPVVGYRDGRTFHVLFLDRDFSLYDHG